MQNAARVFFTLIKFLPCGAAVQSKLIVGGAALQLFVIDLVCLFEKRKNNYIKIKLDIDNTKDRHIIKSIK